MRVHFIQHVSFENPGYLLEWAQEGDHTITFTKVFEKNSFPSPDDLDFLVIMGGPMGIYEILKFPWLKEEKQFIKKVIVADKKVLGICLGSQLIAEVLGKKVFPNKEKEIGWWPVKKMPIEKYNSLLAELPEEFVTFHWHGDTFDLPENSIHLFATDICSNQGFLYGKNVAALQFHPEVNNDLIDSMIEHEREELVSATFIQKEDAIKMETSRRIDQNKKFTSRFVEQFLAL